MQASYNGIPLFEVSAEDFLYISECRLLDSRLLSKNIRNEALREFYTESRKPVFAVSYENTVICWGK